MYPYNHALLNTKLLFPIILIISIAFGAGNTNQITARNQTALDDQTSQLMVDKVKEMQSLKAKHLQGDLFRNFNKTKQLNLKQSTLNQKHVNSPGIPWKLKHNTNKYQHINRVSDNGSRTDTIDVKINGLDDATITQGEDFVVTVTFSTGDSIADVSLWIESDGDGIFDPAYDYDLGEYQQIMDNDMDDENPAWGIYEITMLGGEDGPNRVSNIQFYYEASDGGGSDAGSVSIDPIDSPYSLSGQVSPGDPNIIIVAFRMDDNNDNPDPWMTVTNLNGHFQNFVPDSGLWALMAMDFLGVTDGMIADTSYYDVMVLGHETGFDFNFHYPNSGIEGQVLDFFDNAIPDVDVWASKDGPGYGTTTDSDGYYMMALDSGMWQVGLDEWALIPDYLVPNDVTIELFEYDTTWYDFMVYNTNESISGTVYLNGTPWDGVDIDAWSDIGWTRTHPDPSGNYYLSVSSEADMYGGYSLGINWDNLPPGTLIESMPDQVFSGTTNADIYLVTVSGGIEGYIYDANTMDPIDFGWVHADNGWGGNGTGSWNGGYFYLPLENGVYTVYAGADEYFSESFDNVVIQDNVLQMDFYLSPITIDGSLYGYVTDENGQPLQDVEINVGNDIYWDNTYTDGSGYYWFDLPNGSYGVHAYLDGYMDDWEMVDINFDNIQLDFMLNQIITNGAIEGYVVDGTTGSPVIGADVWAFGNFYDGYAMTSTGGYFHIDVPSDSFWVMAQAPGYGTSNSVLVGVAEYDTVEVTLELYQPMSTPPQIMGIFDVPNDQGRQVHIIWNPGSQDGDMPWTQFSIWRQIPNTDLPPLWDFIATVPFHGMEPYSMVVPTLVDSNLFTGPTGEFWSTFRVTAHAMNPWDFYDSEPAMGYSVDNLHPMAPNGFNAVVDPGQGSVLLTWNPSMEEDFNYYRLTRYTDGSDLIELGVLGDTVFVDNSIESGHEYTYEVTATDFNGNESEASVVSTQVLAIIVGAEIPDSYALSPNYPNPFNPTTELRYDLPEDGFVSIVVYNTLGREVDRLVDEYQGAGQYRVVWVAKEHPSGVYFVRMQSDAFSQTRKMMLIK